MRFKFLVIPLLLISFAAEAQTTRRNIQSSDVTGALGYTPIQSIQGMTGIMTCGTGLLCSSQVLSVSGVPIGNVTGLGTGVAASLATNIGVAGAPVLYNGAGGTPASMTATNLTGTAAGLSIGGNAATATTATTASAVAVGNITGAGSGCITWLTTPSSSNMRGCVTDETGTGLLYFQGGDIGTPSAGVGTNLTALNATQLTTGAVPAARMPALTGDCTTSAGAVATTCTATGGVAFNYGIMSTTTSMTIASGTGTLTTASGALRYQTRGKLTWFQLTVTITTNGTGATNISVSGLPFTFNSMCAGAGRATAGSGKQLQFVATTATTGLSIFNYDNSYPAVSGEVLLITGVCETT